MRARPAAAGLVAVLLVGVAACSSPHGLTRSESAAAATAGVSDAAHLLGATWGPVASASARGADATITERCGDPRAGLGAPSAGILGRAISPLLLRDPNVGASPKESLLARTAVLAYRDTAGARAAFSALDFADFERCLLAAVRSYVHEPHPDANPVPEPSPGQFTVSSPAVSAGDAAMIFAASFDENVLGGFDNSHAVALFVARSGSFLVTAFAACNRQTLNPNDAIALARRLGVSALARATARH